MFGSLIRFCTGQKITHCYQRLPYEGNSQLSIVFHAAAFNVHYLNYHLFQTYQKEIISEWEITVSEAEFAAAQEIRYEEAGKPYGWTQILGYLWVLVGKKHKNPLSDGKKTHVCVELIARILGIDDAESLLVHELEQIVSNMPNTVRISTPLG